MRDFSVFMKKMVSLQNNAMMLNVTDARTSSRIVIVGVCLSSGIVLSKGVLKLKWF